VRQGALGNCWFVGALSVAAERPELIRRMFLAGSHEINPNAAYQVTVRSNRSSVDIVIFFR
jgi:hypothetical protein